MNVDQKMKSYALSIVIPAYNESGKSDMDVIKADKFLKDNNIHGKIIVDDDGSEDKTGQIAGDVLEKIDRQRSSVLSCKENQGKGYAVCEGVAAASGEVVMFIDSGCCFE